MSEYVTIRLAVVLVLGIATQWLAWTLRLPAILLLLLVGLMAGAGTEWLARHEILFTEPFLDPDKLFGDLLLPVVSLAVALILFEGGLTLNVRELASVGQVIARLVSVGGIITLGFTTLAAHYILDLDFLLAVLLGAVLVVTGPTVIGPLLRHVRPSGQVGPILRWEGIVIDPLGAMLAVLVFEIISSGELDAAAVGLTALRTIAVGCAAGAAGAGALLLLLRRAWVPDVLHNPVTLMLVVAAFAGANILQHESGLFAVTVMGIVLANQRLVSVRHIMEFKESLTVLLLSSLFVVLGSRLRLEQLAGLRWQSLLFIATLIVVVRPLAVALCTMRSNLTWRHRAFLAAVAPRGIVAAAVSSVFALRLQEIGFPESERLVPLTFAVIIGTVTVYGLSAGWTARQLGLAAPGRLGFIIVGADRFARALAELIQRHGHQVLLVDTNFQNLQAARLAGLPVVTGSVLARHVHERIELSGIGRLLALTPNDEVNALAAVHFAGTFGRDHVYQLPPDPRAARRDRVSRELQARRLFAKDATHAWLNDQLERGAQLKITPITREFTLEHFRETHGPDARPLMVLSESGEITVLTVGRTPTVRAGESLVSLVPPATARPATAAATPAPAAGPATAPTPTTTSTTS